MVRMASVFSSAEAFESKARIAPFNVREAHSGSASTTVTARGGEVSEILTVPRVTALPRVKDWILGIANVRGRLVPIVDLHRFLGVATTTPRLQWRVLVVEAPEYRVGLVVEQSLGLQHFVTDSFEEGRPDGIALEQRGVLHWQDRCGGQGYGRGRGCPLGSSIGRPLTGRDSN